MARGVRQWIRQGRWSNRLLIILAVVFGLITAVFVYAALSEGGGENEETVAATSRETVPVVIAARDIPARTRISEEIVGVRAVPKDAAHPKAFSSKDKLVGMVSRVPIIAEEHILEDKVAATATELRRNREDLPLSYVVPPGQRAMSIEVNKIGGAGGLIIPGDFVDVIGVFEVEFFGVRQDDPTSRETVDKYVALTVLQNVEVVAVSPAQAQTRALAEEQATLKLSLRGVSDTADSLTPALSSPQLLPPDLPNPFAR